ncbi:Peroxisomal membrane protein 2 [Cinnamomum micranthum f. kanehirae]|uniref:Peroxisomal membrane protein 2 n=1 Tax=Cinnamomum micranthum f. kanehirae TaxID=337451 RepID=A0A3S3N9A4_9MAGN|nr:Peroxisomal membrane protein 2 [Cinnamomum micranthum f. kanehirae]
MASVNSITAQQFLPITKSIIETKPKFGFFVKGLSGSSLHSSCRSLKASKSGFLSGRRRARDWAVGSVADELDVIPVQSSDSTDQQEGGAVILIEREQEIEGVNQVGGFTNEGRFSFEGGVAGDFQGFSSSAASLEKGEEEDLEKLIDRAINATIVLAAGTFAITKLLTIDRDYWHGWTLYEILRYAPQHNWSAYEEALKTNPVLAKMVISGVVYSLGDWIAQCYEGKPLFEFDRSRMFRSGIVGFSLHGSLSHYYYQLCEALFPFEDWWVVPAKVVFDQTVWAAVWNSIYYVLLGFLRFESPANILGEMKATFWPMLTAGWKLWPFAHLITYGVVPVEQRLLWVDCVELIWVTILSTYSNEKSEARGSNVSLETSTNSNDPKE